MRMLHLFFEGIVKSMASLEVLRRVSNSSNTSGVNKNVCLRYLPERMLGV